MERPTESTRLPRSAQLPSRGAQVARGLFALVATAAVVVGVPVLLYAGFGTPWPDSRPSLDWLTQPTTTEALLGVLAAVVWLAWAHFVVCLVVEAVAERRRRGLAPQVPGGGVGTQALARRAVATIALLAGTAAGTMGTASAAMAPASDAGATQAVASTVVAGEQTGSRAGVDATAKAGPQGADRATGAQDKGAQTGLPQQADLVQAKAAHAGLTTYYEVRPPEGRNYDTLWDVAERYLGNGVRYKEIWELNKGLVQADGQTLRDADLIHPGWVVRLPDDARGPGLKVVHHEAEAASSGPSVVQAGNDTSATQAAGAQGQVEPGVGGVAGGSGSGAGGLGSAILDEAWRPLYGVAGGLALAGAFLGLRRRRASMSTRQLWAGALGTGPEPSDPTDPTDPTDPDRPRGGGRLRQEADTGAAAWLDRALRAYGSGPAPAPARAWVGGSGAVLAFDEAPEGEPAAPWTVQGERVWSLDRGAALDAPSGTAPLPGLVCAGRRDDGTLLMLDPESVPGVLALDGDTSVARGLAMSMALDTATHAWADTRSVTLVGFADDLTPAGNGNIRRTDDLGRVLEGLDNVARHQRSACRAAGVGSVREARAVAPKAIDWTYHLVLCSGVPNPEELRVLHELAADPGVSLGVVVIGEVPRPGLGLTARSDGRLAAPLHGIDVTAQVLSVPAVRAITELYTFEEAERAVSLEQVVDRIHAEGPTPATQADVHLGVLGPVTLTAPGDVDDDRRDFLTELAGFLALHPGGVHVNRISAALWPRGVEPEVRDSALRQLATWLGTTDQGESVLAEASGVWSLAPGAVSVDWDTFRESLNAAGHQPDRAEHHLRAALDQVRGRPFDGVPDGRYGWLESTSTEADMALAVVLTATTLAEKAAARGDADAARHALRDGLEVAPASEDLWGSRLRLEATFGDDERLRGAADEMYDAIATHGSPIGAGPQTDALVDELLPGYRSRVA